MQQNASEVLWMLRTSRCLTCVESKSSVLVHSTELSEMGNTGENRGVPQAGLSEGPMKVSAGNLCDVAREFGVWLECNRDL